MNTRIATAALLTAISQAVPADDASPISFDGGFQNMLNHEPYAGPTAVTVARGEADAGESLIHAALRGEEHPALARTEDPSTASIRSSFGRMLDHAPYGGPTAVTVAYGEPDAGERLVHAVLRGEPHLLLANRYDPYLENLSAAFARMLDHAPYAGPTAVTVAREHDRHVDELVTALRQGRSTHGTLIASH